MFINGPSVFLISLRQIHCLVSIEEIVERASHLSLLQHESRHSVMDPDPRNVVLEIRTGCAATSRHLVIENPKQFPVESRIL